MAKKNQIQKAYITENDLRNANTYVPLMKKVEFVDQCATACFDRLTITPDGSMGAALPYMYKENSQIKSRFLMGALVKLYLSKDFVPAEGTEFLMSADDYDRYAGAHIFNQIERMKGKGVELRDIAFDLLHDFKDLEKRLNSEIYGLLQAQNDVVSRFQLLMTAQTSPEAFAAQRAELDALMKEFEALKQGRSEETQEATEEQ